MEGMPCNGYETSVSVCEMQEQRTANFFLVTLEHTEFFHGTYVKNSDRLVS